MSRALWLLVLSRLRQFWREPETIFWVFFFPVLLAVVLGVAFRTEGTPAARAAVVSGPGADAMAAALRRGVVVVEIVDPQAAARRLRAGEVALVVVPGSPVRYRFDPSRPESLLAREVVDAAVQQSAGRRRPTSTVDEPVTARGSRYIDFLVPGLLGMNLMGGGLWGLGWYIVEARTRRLLKRLLATPMRRWQFVLALIIARVFFVPFEALTLLGLTWLVFDVGVAGAVSTLALVLLAGTLAFAGLGGLMASRARTLETMSGLINLASLPMIVLSGVFFPVGRFPEAIQPIIRALPLTVLCDATRAVMLDGASLISLGPELLVLALWGLVSFGLALRLFRWT